MFWSGLGLCLMFREFGGFVFLCFRFGGFLVWGWLVLWLVFLGFWFAWVSVVDVVCQFLIFCGLFVDSFR